MPLKFGLYPCFFFFFFPLSNFHLVLNYNPPPSTPGQAGGGRQLPRQPQIYCSRIITTRLIQYAKKNNPWAAFLGDKNQGIGTAVVGRCTAVHPLSICTPPASSGCVWWDGEPARSDGRLLQEQSGSWLSVRMRKNNQGLGWVNSNSLQCSLGPFTPLCT